ncbi:Nif3-like dinuclear metal center hexameric protein [Pelovirga terrestris]|uniref:GTP cyclohydrolase 1 type 2 homolog n=1 Tax=Pelovirga terrestris TaxID=2771352 RepID=A0A8J6QR45_9BACT|nr:Nif3-like dinuclear metal center hexameric protein [Pelovirga terrestris]MBD1400628.1 Nif3-like dinuclear metal center hexameric protein [Pelovirga terrestris]
MAEKNTARVADIVGLINRISPPHLAEDWDNVGLQVGDPGAPVRRILVCLDAERGAVEEAARLGADLIVCHHPLIFRPLKRITPGDPAGDVIFRAISRNIAIIAAHTNLDRSVDGLNDWLAAQLGLAAVTPLERPRSDGYYKLVVYVPSGHENAVMEAMFAAGAGHIGAYDRCSFRTSGIGTFRGGVDTDPFIGTPGIEEEAEELRLETIIPIQLRDRILTRMIKAHPYEEVAYDLIPLANPVHGPGLGRIGVLKQKLTLEAFAHQVKIALDVAAVRIVGAADRLIGKVAVCGGGGMVTYADAQRLGADCLVTGDIKFHEAQRARADGVALIDAGHFGTEKIMMTKMAELLTSLTAEQGLGLEVITMTTEHDPFVTIT